MENQFVANQAQTAIRTNPKVMPGWPACIQPGPWYNASRIEKPKAIAVLSRREDSDEAVIRLAGDFDQLAEIQRDDFEQLLEGVDRSRCYVYLEARRTPAPKILQVWDTVISVLRG